MDIFELSPFSALLGVVAVIGVAVLRFYFPFRYQYYCQLVKYRPKLVNRLLLRSYRKNKTVVGLLDKATSEMLSGAYDEAERFLIEGIQLVINLGGMQNRFIRNFFFNHLSWLLFYKGHHKESLEIALRLYERVPSTPNILALISCNLSRMGEVGRAIEIMSKLSQKGKASSSVLLSCEAEIEAAKGNLQKALELFHQAKKRKSYASIYYIQLEIEKRIGQLSKVA